jgi:drug/metabolite transporter (DMT)-like permease
VLTLILSGILLGERLRLRQGAGFLVSLAGTALVILVSHGAWGTISRGDLLVLGAPVTWAIFTVVGRRVMTGLSPMAATAWSCLAGTLLLAPAAGIEAWLGAPAGSLSLAGWAALLQLVLMGTVAGFVWWYEGVLALGASRAAVYVNLVPVFGVLLSAAILGERLAPLQAVGGVMVLAGVRLVQAGGSPTS